MVLLCTINERGLWLFGKTYFDLVDIDCISDGMREMLLKALCLMDYCVVLQRGNSVVLIYCRIFIVFRKDRGGYGF